MNPDYERVYHYHIRKTAGTSLNAAFWALAGLDLDQMSDRSAVEGNGLKLVRGNAELIAKGDYFFANSHQPAYRLSLPPATFTVTILRDPAARAISYYRYLLWARGDGAAREKEPFIDNVLAESAFLDRGARSPLARLGRRRRGEVGFAEFLERVPAEHLLTQLQMFSERLDPTEAAERVLACSAVCFTETFPEDLRRLALVLGLELEQRRERSFGEPVSLTEAERDLLRERLAPEYAMVDRVRAGLASRAEAA